MKDKIFGVLQRVGRSFMLPIAILPVAGLLLGFGSSFTNETTIATYGLQKILGDGTILHALLIIMNKVGSAVFDNLPLIFAVGVAVSSTPLEMDAIGSCFIGGASAYGGTGTVPGVIIGALLMGVLNLGMSIMGIDQNIQKVVKGLVLLAAVIFDVVSKRKSFIVK